MFKKFLSFVLGLALIIYSIFNFLQWKKPIETTGYHNFLAGNKIILEDKNKSPELKKEALEKYKLAMETNTDINIKRNFEIIQQKLEDQQKQENNENKQDNQQKKENNKQGKEDKNSQDKNNESNKNNKENSSSSDEKQKENQDKNRNQEQNKQQSDNKSQSQENDNQPNNSNNSPQNASQNPEKTSNGKEDELKSILERLEGNEKNAFKNNERVMQIQNTNYENNSNRW